MQTQRCTKRGDLGPVEQADRIAIPVRDIAGDLKNIRLYKPGALQFKIISWARSTGKNALFPAWPLMGDMEEKLGEYTTPIFLCEGESDTICALSHGFNAITQTSKVKKWPEDQ